MNTPTIRSSHLVPIVLLTAALLSACASPQQRLTSAAILGNEAELAGMLSKGGDLNAPAAVSASATHCPGARTLTPLQAAACAGRKGVVKLLLEHKADPNASGTAHESPLIFAVRGGHPGAARLLVEGGGKAYAKDARGRPVVILAAELGDPELVKLLLDRGAKVGEADSRGGTALMAASNGATAILLLARGAKITRVDNNGRTALHTAAARGRAVVVKLLLERGANVEFKDKRGVTAFALARAGKHAAATRVLEEEGRRLISKKLAVGDRAARAGDQNAALSIYTAALSRAGGLDGKLADEIRVKIVKYAAGLSTPPAVPPKAREHIVRAKYLLKKGRATSEVEKEMAAAVDAAPWWAEGYYNLGLVQANQNKFQEAMRTLRLFLDAAPDSPNARAAEDKLFELKIAQEEAEKIAGMTGNWNGWSVSVKGNQLRIVHGGKTFSLTMKQDNLEGSVQSRPYGGANNCTIPGQMHPVSGKVSSDRKVIELDYVWSSYDTRYHCVDMFGMASNCCLMCSKVCDAVSIVSTTNIHERLTR